MGKKRISRRCRVRARGGIRIRSLLAFAAFATIGSVTRAEAQDSTAARPWYEAISVNGFVSSSYSYNFNRPLFPVNGYRVFDFDDKSFKVDVAELVLQKPTPRAGDAGFRVDVAAGGSIPRVSAAAGAFPRSL